VNAGARASLRRLKALIRKEAWQIVRDPSSIAIAFVLPLVLLLIFGYGVSLDATHVPVALVVERPSPQTMRFTSAFDHSEYFAPIPFTDIRHAQEAMTQGRVWAMVWLRDNFSQAVLAAREAPIGVIVDGVDANSARIVEGYLQGAWLQYLVQEAQSRGAAPTTQISLQERIWFNPEVRSRNFLVPGLVAVIMTLIGALSTAMVVAREWERGTMEALWVTPVRVAEVLLGKLIPYFVLGMGGMLFTVAMALWLFEVPLRGSFWVLLVSSMLFLLAALGMGLLISTVARNQFVAGQVAIIATFLPAFILSGFIFDIGSMPTVVQLLTHIIAARYFIAILQTVFLAGNVWPVFAGNALALLGMAVLFLLLVRRRTKKSLE
jgi:ABC-2 type transport system permease protein